MCANKHNGRGRLDFDPYTTVQNKSDCRFFYDRIGRREKLEHQNAAVELALDKFKRFSDSKQDSAGTVKDVWGRVWHDCQSSRKYPYD